MLYYTDAIFARGNMARITLVERDAATAEIKEIYEKVLKGKPGNVQKAMAHLPEVLKNFLPFYGSVGRSLDRKLYEEIYIRVSWLNGCGY
jgi:alkylhydroperoxidase family enzyme